MSRIPFSVTNNSLTFFVKGRPHGLHKDHENFATVRKLLLTPGVDHDVEQLMDLVDARRAYIRASFGRIQFDRNEILWQGKPLHNIWVERIIQLRAEGLDHEPLFNALDRLVQNPTPQAIERLPIFLDRVALPFMPDGRFLAFKGVTANYESAHVSPDGTRFRHQVGDKPRMPREAVDPNPSNTCSTGLHVGAPGYVREHYSGGSYALVLVAVDPIDVVSVPTDYDGEKMRVCGYEVIEHLDQDYSDEQFGRIRSTYIEPKPAPAPEPAPAPAERQFSGPELAAIACVGDYVTIGDYHPEDIADGTYRVCGVDAECGTAADLVRVKIEMPDGSTDWVYNGAILRLTRDGVEVRPSADIEPAELSDFERLKVGDVIEYEDDLQTITYGRVQQTAPVKVFDMDGELFTVDEEDDFVRLVPENEVTAAMVVTKGTLVRIKDHSFLQDGDYTIAGFNEEDGDADQVDGESTFWSVLVDGRRLPILNRNITVANHKGEHLWPRQDFVPVKVQEDPAFVDAGIRVFTNLADLVIGTTEITDEMVREVQVENVQIGQKVEVASGAFPPAGIYPVVAVYHGRVQVQTEFDGIVFVNHDQIVRVVTDA